MQKREYFCPSCKKIVEDVSAVFGSAWVATTGTSPDHVCMKCDTVVIELTKNDNRTKTELI